MERTFFFQIEPTLGGNIFVSDFFFNLSDVQADFFPDYWNKTANFWESVIEFLINNSYVLYANYFFLKYFSAV